MKSDKPIDIVILTDRRYVNPEKTDAYTENVLLEDDLVQKALEAEGFNVEKRAWDDADFDWARTHTVLFRSTWDYFERFDAFSRWFDKVSGLTQMINPEKLIRWNIDKHYLRDLSEKGTAIIPTRFIEKGSSVHLSDLIEETGWSNAILKPCVSGGAWNTFRIHTGILKNVEAEFQRLIRTEAMMLQPFIDSIPEIGEVSMIVIGGKFTHAVLKKAKPGDFRVQDDHGGTIHEYTPAENEIVFAEKAVANCDEQPVYARVDLAKDHSGAPLLVELELIEPELWFRRYKAASEELAKAIRKYFSDKKIGEKQ